MTRFSVLPAVLLTLLAAPASAKVLTVCGGTPGDLGQASARPYASYALAASGGLVRPLRIALTEDAGGYDLRLNWGEANERSLRAGGANILSTGPDASLVHLMVARSDAAPVEHYLFQLDQAGRGELLSGQDTDDLTSGLARFTCGSP